MSLRILTGILVLLGSAGMANAQHYHRHGNHYDYHQNVPHGHDAYGHLVDRSGHHIDGHGHHTGSVGVYENGSYSVPSYYSTHSGYQQSYLNSYSYPPVVPAPFVSSPSVIYSAPSVISSSTAIPSSSTIVPSPPLINSLNMVTANKIPVGQANLIPKIGSVGGQVKLTNPRSTDGQLSYMLNNISYTIKAGESQTIALDRQWIIRFDNGLGKEVVYRLSEGQYEFTVSEEAGWNVGKSIEDEVRPPAPISDAPTLPKNQISRQLSPAENSLPSAAIETIPQ